MAFKKKTWLGRIAEYPNRRRLTKEDGSSELVTVSREEGQISQEGDAFSPDNFNDLEKRISDGFDDVNQSLEGLTCVKYVTETLTVSANVWREYTFKNLPNHKLSIAMIMSGDDVSKTNGCYVRRNFDTTGKIYVYSPISQNLQIALIMFIF